MKQRRIRCLAAAAFVLLFLGAAWFTRCDLSLMWSRRDHLTDIAAKMFPPDWGFLGKVLPLLWATIQMSITGTFLGAVLSIPAAMACAAASNCCTAVPSEALAAASASAAWPASPSRAASRAARAAWGHTCVVAALSR